MMTYIQGGATLNGYDFKTKKSLREQIAHDASQVLLYDTSAFNPRPLTIASELPDGVTWTVVGPDPYFRRTWYANVTRGKDGEVRVK